MRHDEGDDLIQSGPFLPLKSGPRIASHRSLENTFVVGPGRSLSRPNANPAYVGVFASAMLAAFEVASRNEPHPWPRPLP